MAIGARRAGQIYDEHIGIAGAAGSAVIRGIRGCDPVAGCTGHLGIAGQGCAGAGIRVVVTTADDGRPLVVCHLADRDISKDVPHVRVVLVVKSPQRDRIGSGLRKTAGGGHIQGVDTLPATAEATHQDGLPGAGVGGCSCA